MTVVTFYLVDDTSPQTVEVDQTARIYQKVIQLCCNYQQQDARIFIFSENKTQAEQLDEYLWQLPLDNFISHHLIGESHFHANTVEIGWAGTRPQSRRNILINLTQDVPNFAPSFAQVIDFVPCDDTLKQRARERYQIYRQAGHQLHTLAIDTPSNT